MEPGPDKVNTLPLSSLPHAITVFRWSRRFGVSTAFALARAVLFKPELFSVRIPELGRRVWLRTGNTDLEVLKQVLAYKQYESPLPFPVKTIIDAGANIGLSTLAFHIRFPEARILAIEPDRANLEMLRRNVAGIHQITIIPGALWSHRTQLSFLEEANASFASRLSQEGKNTVEAYGLADLLAQYGIEQVDLLKVDIEGAEKQVFEKGSETWLPKVSALMIELHDWIVPGASRSVFSAAVKHPFDMHNRGETQCLVFKRRTEDKACD